MIAPYWHLPSKHNSNICQALFGLYIVNYHRKCAGEEIIFNTGERTRDFNEYWALNVPQASLSKFLITIKRKPFRANINSNSTISRSQKGPLKETVRLIAKAITPDTTGTVYMIIGRLQLLLMISKHFTS